MLLSVAIGSRMRDERHRQSTEGRTLERTAAPKLSSHGSKNALYLKTAIKAK